MTFYPGGKKRFARFIVDAIMEDFKSFSGGRIHTYFEPFCGMASVFADFADRPGSDEWVYVLADRNPYLIQVLKGLKRGLSPPSTCTRATYERSIRDRSTTFDSLYLGFACAYRGDFRSTYFPNNNMHTQAERSKALGRLLRRRRAHLQCAPYHAFRLKRALIYCDPPYEDTQCPYRVGDAYEREFDTPLFLEWCQDRVRDGNIVYVSEYRNWGKREGMKLIWKRGQQRLYRVVLRKKGSSPNRNE